MAEFVRAQIFGTTFEITSRYSDLQPVGMGAFGLVWYVLHLSPLPSPLSCLSENGFFIFLFFIFFFAPERRGLWLTDFAWDSSARDQLTNQNVAVKKIMKPFSTPVLAKRTYRELKLLKHLRHENVISLSDIFISPLEDMYVAVVGWHSPSCPPPPFPKFPLFLQRDADALSPAISSLSSSARISTASSLRAPSRRSSSSTSCIRSWYAKSPSSPPPHFPMRHATCAPYDSQLTQPCSAD